MRTHLFALVAAAMTIAVTIAPRGAATAIADGHETPPAQTADAPKTIVETAIAAGSFKTLVAAVKAADLVEALSGEGPFTVFAPTDEAFAALPEGTVAALLEAGNLATLQRVLTYHVVAGRVTSSDLLPVREAQTLAGDAVPIGLRVGRANVVTADIECSNGVIHVIDAVLLPPAKGSSAADAESVAHVVSTLESAIDRGVPLYNGGDEDGCARVYREAAKQLVSGDHLRELHTAEMTAALTAPTESSSDEAWQLRAAFDLVMADLAFEPRAEAPLPKGFPGPGPVGRIVVKDYPKYRAARAEGGRAFWTLFNHIKKNEVAMTSPVEMTMGEGDRMMDMAFLYESPTQGDSGEQGDVDVLDLEPLRVLSIGLRGRRSPADLKTAKRLLQTRLAADGLAVAGPWRTLGYNSPMVPADQQFWELQVPVKTR